MAYRESQRHSQGTHRNIRGHLGPSSSRNRLDDAMYYEQPLPMRPKFQSTRGEDFMFSSETNSHRDYIDNRSQKSSASETEEDRKLPAIPSKPVESRRRINGSPPAFAFLHQTGRENTVSYANKGEILAFSKRRQSENMAGRNQNLEDEATSSETRKIGNRQSSFYRAALEAAGQERPPPPIVNTSDDGRIARELANQYNSQSAQENLETVNDEKLARELYRKLEQEEKSSVRTDELLAMELSTQLKMERPPTEGDEILAIELSRQQEETKVHSTVIPEQVEILERIRSSTEQQRLNLAISQSAVDHGPSTSRFDMHSYTTGNSSTASYNPTILGANSSVPSNLASSRSLNPTRTTRETSDFVVSQQLALREWTDTSPSHESTTVSIPVARPIRRTQSLQASRSMQNMTEELLSGANSPSVLNRPPLYMAVHSHPTPVETQEVRMQRRLKRRDSSGGFQASTPKPAGSDELVAATPHSRSMMRTIHQQNRPNSFGRSESQLTRNRATTPTREARRVASRPNPVRRILWGRNRSAASDSERVSRSPPPSMEPSDYVIRKGKEETRNAITQGNSHVVRCQGCNGKLHAPMRYSLVYCPHCQTVSPGQTSSSAPPLPDC